MNSLTDQTVLLTGASGFIGTHLCAALIAGKNQVHAVSRRIPAQAEAQVRWWKTDLADASAVRQVVTSVKPDVIMHLASHVVGTRQREAVLPTFYSNLASTVHLLDAAAELGCRRIILTGSLEEPSPDEANPVPCSPYAAAKWASAGYAAMFHELYKLPVVVLRLFMVYGPGQRDTKKLIPYVITSLMRGQAPALMSGTRPVDWIYVDDVVQAFLAASTATGAEGKTFDVGSGMLVTVAEIVDELVGLMDSKAAPVFGAVADRPLERVRVAEVNASQHVLGWQPTIGLREGLRRTIAWYEKSAAVTP